MAIVFSATLSAAFADTGKTPSEDIAGKLCERMAAGQIKKQKEAAPEPHTSTPAVRVDGNSGATGAM